VRKMVHIARVLLGLVFLILGLNGFYTFIPVPSFHPFMQILVSSGYIYFIKAIEVTAGVLLLANRAVTLALVLLGADIANILAYHLLLDHRDWPIVPIVAGLYALVLWEHRTQVRFLFRWKA
jgi:putative oxidoreductase